MKTNATQNEIQTLAKQGKFEEAMALYIAHPDCANPGITIGHFAQLMRDAISSTNKEASRVASMKSAMGWA